MEQETQKKVMEFSMLEQENKKLEQQLTAVNQQLTSFEELSEDVGNISNHQGEFLASIGQGVFIKSEIKDSKKILVNIGSGIIAEKDSKDAQRIIKEQAKKLADAKKEIEGIVKNNFDSMIKIEGELQQLAQKAKK